jgi:Zn-dependent M28 family amino/carboxypeptidase
MSGILRERLQHHVEVLAAEIGERHVWRPRALAAAAHYIEEVFSRSGYEVRRQEYEAEGVACTNLEVERLGQERPAEIILVGAHYDTVEGCPGADDNASGVAAMLEIARLLRDQQPGCTVRCVAFVNEEPPFFHSRSMGSAVYARAARARGDDIKLMLSLEMVGYFSRAPRSQRYPPLFRFFYPEHGDFIAFVSNWRSRLALVKVHEAFRSQCAVPSERLASPAVVPGVSWSDQRSFWRMGYRALMVTDTAFYRNPHYHRPTDTPDTLDFDSMACVTAGLAGAIAALTH